MLAVSDDAIAIHMSCSKQDLNVRCSFKWMPRTARMFYTAVDKGSGWQTEGGVSARSKTFYSRMARPAENSSWPAMPHSARIVFVITIWISKTFSLDVAGCIQSYKSKVINAENFNQILIWTLAAVVLAFTIVIRVPKFLSLKTISILFIQQSNSYIRWASSNQLWKVPMTFQFSPKRIGNFIPHNWLIRTNFEGRLAYKKLLSRGLSLLPTNPLPHLSTCGWKLWPHGACLAHCRAVGEPDTRNSSPGREKIYISASTAQLGRQRIMTLSSSPLVLA